jgi:hypothetical protein
MKKYLVTKTWISGPFHGSSLQVIYTYLPNIGTYAHRHCIISNVIEL